MLRSEQKASAITLAPNKTCEKIGAFYDLHSRDLFAIALKILEDPREAEEALFAVFTQMPGVLPYYEFKAHKRFLAWAILATMRTASAMKANPGCPVAITNNAFG